MSPFSAICTIYILAAVQIQHILIQGEALLSQCSLDIILLLTCFHINGNRGSDHTTQSWIDGVQSPKGDLVRKSIQWKGCIFIFLNNTVPSDAISAARASFASITSSRLENSDLK